MRPSIEFLKNNLKLENLIIAEIGVNIGFNANDILENIDSIKEFHLIDDYVHNTEDSYNKAIDVLIKFKDKVIWHKTDSITASKNFNDSYFDFVYIDADHEYEAVKNDILHWWPKVKKGGLLCGHDYATPAIPGVSVAVNEVICKIFNLFYFVKHLDWWVIKT